jgi:hypothetical protein
MKETAFGMERTESPIHLYERDDFILAIEMRRQVGTEYSLHRSGDRIGATILSCRRRACRRWTSTSNLSNGWAFYFDPIVEQHASSSLFFQSIIPDSTPAAPFPLARDTRLSL